MAETSPEKYYKLSSLDQLKALLKESGWTNDKISGFFGGIDGVNNPFQERNISESQLKELAKKLDSLKTKYEQKLVLNQFALGTLIENIGTTYSFVNPVELQKALEEQGVIYPKEYLHQPNGTFLPGFTAPRHLAKERFDKLVVDLKAIQGDTAKNNADRGEVIRTAFGYPESRAILPDSKEPSLSQNPSNGTREIQEALNEINPDSLEKAITISESFIRLVPNEEMKYTLRGVHGAIIINTLRQAGHNIVLKNGKIEIIPKSGVDVVRIQEKLQTLIETQKIPLDAIKVGMLYSSESFKKYTEDKKTADGKISPATNTQDFLKYIKDLQASGSNSPDIQALLASQTMISGVNFPQAIKGFQDLGQVGEWMTQNPKAVENAQAAVNIPQSPSGTPSSGTTPTQNSDNPVQNGANTVAGKGAEFAGAMADNIGGFAKGVSQALGEGFRQGGAIGGLAVAVISIMGAWKFLTGNWGTKNHKMSGWMIALLGFGGKAGYDMMKKYGLLDGDSESGGTPSGRSRKGQETTDTSGKGASDDAADTAPESAPEVKLTPTQQKATKAVNDDIRISKYFGEKQTQYTAKKEEYVDFINKNLKDISVQKLLPSSKSSYGKGDDKANIFSPQATLDLGVQLPNGLSPIILKDMLRVYVFGLSYPIGSLVEKRKSIDEKIHEKKVISSDTLLSAAAKIWGITDTPVDSTTPKEGLSLPQATEKLKSYRIVLQENGKDTVFSSTTAGVVFNVAEYQNGGFALDISHDLLSRPIEVAFDKQAKLDQNTVKVLLFPLGQKEYSLKQQGNDIIATRTLSA